MNGNQIKNGLFSAVKFCKSIYIYIFGDPKILSIEGFTILLCIFTFGLILGNSSPLIENNKTEDNNYTTSAENSSAATTSEEQEDTTFCFLGEAVERKENFDKCPYQVTLENVDTLYRKYNVIKIDDTDLYKIVPKQLYTNSVFFTRLLKFENGRQVAAATFYGWRIPYIFEQEDGYLVAMNSLASPVGCNESTYTCKTVLLNKSLEVVKDKEYKYKEQKDAYYAYAYIDTLYQEKDGYGFKIINKGFDADDHFEYVGHLSPENVVTSSSKKTYFPLSTIKSNQQTSPHSAIASHNTIDCPLLYINSKLSIR